MTPTSQSTSWTRCAPLFPRAHSQNVLESTQQDVEGAASFSTKAQAPKLLALEATPPGSLKGSTEQLLCHSSRCCVPPLKEFPFSCALPKSKTTVRPELTTFRRYGFRLFLVKKSFHNGEKTNSTPPLHWGNKVSQGLKQTHHNKSNSFFFCFWHYSPQPEKPLIFF